MITLEHLQLLLSALSMKSKSNLSDEQIYERYQSLMNLGGEEALVDLWRDLDSVPCICDWPEAEYHPEDALKKRALLLARQVTKDFNGKYPDHLNFKMSDDFQHLVMHGKLGLMALLFSLQESNDKVKTPEFSPLVEKFMTYIEGLTEELLFSCSTEKLAKALALAIPSEKMDFVQWVQGRLQPFAMMRSLYLEQPASNMSPLEWWVAHERFIPALPEC